MLNSFKAFQQYTRFLCKRPFGPKNGHSHSHFGPVWGCCDARPLGGAPCAGPPTTAVPSANRPRMPRGTLCCARCPGLLRESDGCGGAPQDCTFHFLPPYFGTFPAFVFSSTLFLSLCIFFEVAKRILPKWLCLNHCMDYKMISDFKSFGVSCSVLNLCPPSVPCSWGIERAPFLRPCRWSCRFCPLQSLDPRTSTSREYFFSNSYASLNVQQQVAVSAVGCCLQIHQSRWRTRYLHHVIKYKQMKHQTK